jgi:hypothetical protein
LNDPVDRIDPSGRISTTELIFCQAIDGAFIGGIGGTIEGFLSELYDWANGDGFSAADMGQKALVGAAMGAIYGGGKAAVVGKAIRNRAQREALYDFVVGIGQGLFQDYISKQKGAAGLNKLDAATTMHNVAVNALVESMW